MRTEMEAGTDAGSLLLFDPDALPGDLKRQFQNESEEILDRLTRSGRACRIQTDTDGSFGLHVYVDEPIPDALWDYVKSPQAIVDFQAPSGMLHFTGAEDAFRDDPTGNQHHARMKSALQIRPGSYHLTVYRTAYPAGLLQTAFRAAVAPWDYWLWGSMSLLIPLALAAWIGLVVIYFTTARIPYHQYLAVGLGVIFALPFAIRLTTRYRSLKDRYARLEHAFPALVARLAYRGPINRG